MLIYVQLT